MSNIFLSDRYEAVLGQQPSRMVNNYDIVLYDFRTIFLSASPKKMYRRHFHQMVSARKSVFRNCFEPKTKMD